MIKSKYYHHAANDLKLAVDCGVPVIDRKRIVQEIKIKVKNEEEALKFIQNVEIIKRIKTDYFEKWYSMIVEMEKSKVTLEINKPYLRVVNSDIICTISYIDTILNDICNYLKDQPNGTHMILFLLRNHFFGLLTLVRPVILHTAHINLYYQLKDKIESLNYDIFAKIPKPDKTKIKKDDKTILDALAGMIDIYDFDSGDKISILSQINSEVKSLLPENKITDLNKVKYLEMSITKEFPQFLKDRELEVLYETTSKVFHRHEILMMWLNEVLIKNNNSGNVVDDIFRIVKLSVFLLGLQLKIFFKLINKNNESSGINNDLSNLINNELNK